MVRFGFMDMETKMPTIKIYDYDHATGKGITRDATPEEIAELEAVSVNMAELKNAETAAHSAKAAVLEKLGLTEEELKAVLG